MTTIDDGGPAYPGKKWSPIGENGSGEYVDTKGMSLRDAFAMHAPEQFSTNADASWVAKVTGVPCPPDQVDYKAVRAFWIEAEAVARYQYADAMLKARKQ